MSETRLDRAQQGRCNAKEQRELGTEIERLDAYSNSLADTLSFLTAAIDPAQSEATSDRELTDPAWRDDIRQMIADKKRLTSELAKVKTDYRTYVDGVDHATDEEVTRLTLAVLFFAKHYDGPPDNMLSADERHLFAEPERIRAKENQ